MFYGTLILLYTEYSHYRKSQDLVYWGLIRPVARYSREKSSFDILSCKKHMHYFIKTSMNLAIYVCLKDASSGKLTN